MTGSVDGTRMQPSNHDMLQTSTPFSVPVAQNLIVGALQTTSTPRRPGTLIPEGVQGRNTEDQLDPTIKKQNLHSSLRFGQARCAPLCRQQRTGSRP